MQTERSGGVYCSECKKCICQPRKRKNWQPETFITCDECDKDVLEVFFCPSEESIRTHFKVKYKDIQKLIDELIKANFKIISYSS